MGDLILVSKNGDTMPVPAYQYQGIIVAGEQFTFEALEEIVQSCLTTELEDTRTVNTGDKKVKITIEVL